MTTTLQYYTTDHLGSRKSIFTENGTIIKNIDYSIWGESTDEDASFTGKELDSTGLYYFNARYYDPSTCRFVTEDPAKQGDGWYNYCENNPLNMIDKDGKRPAVSPIIRVAPLIGLISAIPDVMEAIENIVTLPEDIKRIIENNRPVTITEDNFPTFSSLSDSDKKTRLFATAQNAIREGYNITVYEPTVGLVANNPSSNDTIYFELVPGTQNNGMLQKLVFHMGGSKEHGYDDELSVKDYKKYFRTVLNIMKPQNGDRAVLKPTSGIYCHDKTRPLSDYNVIKAFKSELSKYHLKEGSMLPDYDYTTKININGEIEKTKSGLNDVYLGPFYNDLSMK